MTRLRTLAGILAAVGALGWSWPVSPDGTGTMTVSPVSVQAAQATALTFTYTTAAGQNLKGGEVTLAVPQGWTPPSPAPGPGYTYVSCSPGCQLTVSPGTTTITISDVGLAPGQTLAISYGSATAPGAAGTAIFGAEERSFPGGSLTPLLSSPAVTVASSSSASPSPSPSPSASSSSPASASASPSVTGAGGPGLGKTAGRGTMTVSPDRVAAARPGTLTFTYTAGVNGLRASGEVTLIVPPGWTPPSRAPGTAGYTTSRPGALSVSGRRITVTGVTLGSAKPLIITYRVARAPSAAGVFVFRAFQMPAAARTLAVLAPFPSVVVAVPSRSPFHELILLVLVLLAAAGAAGLLAARFLRNGPPQSAAPGVQAVPHAGPPTSVTIHDTGTQPTLTVRIEPHASTAVPTIEEVRT